MKKLFILAVLMLAVATTQAQKHHGVYAIGFYNLENLFDYTHDEGKKDEDFLPTGRYQWNQTKYEWKLRNLSRVLSKMGTEVLPKQGCAVIGRNRSRRGDTAMCTSRDRTIGASTVR